MKDYVIITDSSCDLTEEMLKSISVEAVQLDVLVDGEEPKLNCDVDIKDFYKKLRDGKMAKTSAVNVNGFKKAFKTYLEKGIDVLYLGFSSGLSNTYNSGRIAAEEISEKYPDSKVLAVDTLCASMGQGLLVYHAAKQKEQGKTIEEVAKFVEENRLHLVHWFTVDDLQFLKRGGRVSATVALVGSALGIKPVLHVDNDGFLVNVSKTRGRASSIKSLASNMGKSVLKPIEEPIFISHGDCIEDAEMLAEIIKKDLGVKEVVINYVGPVIGAHSGPGTLALFYLGSER